MSQIAGHHHISMITKTAGENHHFYQDILGLRRVKKTVNQENPKMYHLFYGDITGSPGTELTFFRNSNRRSNTSWNKRNNQNRFVCAYNR